MSKDSGDPLDIAKTMMPSDDSTSSFILKPNVIIGQYRIICMLGRGGMGEVYEVEHQVLHRKYALKLLPSDFVTRAGALERFQREAQVMANLEHPNIIKVDEFGETAGRYWLRMELAEGIQKSEIKSQKKHPSINDKQRIVSLADLTEAYDGKIPQEELLAILKQVLVGLAYAHEQGVIHRDLKPGNVLLQSTGRDQKLDFSDQKQITAKISDFGLVKLVGEEWVRSRAEISIRRSLSLGEAVTVGGTRSVASEGTSTQSLLGTYEYMSPEQKRGEDVDERSDIYALGLMSFKLLTGKVPGLKMPSQIDKELVTNWDSLLVEALEDHRQNRLADCRQFIARLGTIEEQINDQGRQVAEKWQMKTRPSQSQAPSPQAATPIAGLGKKVQTGPRAGSDWTLLGIGMEFVWIETLNGWVSKYDITNGEYRKYKPDHNSGEYKGHSLNMERQPVVMVNFDDAKAFAEWLTERERQAGRLPEGYQYCLPDGDKWTKFAQCGDGRRYPWGNEWPPKYGNYADETAMKTFEKDWISIISGYNDGYAVTCQVEQSGKNPWGLYGVGGNVWEWTSEAHGASRVLRGASWDSVEDDLQCVSRYSSDPLRRCDYIGFRLLLSHTSS